MLHFVDTETSYHVAHRPCHFHMFPLNFSETEESLLLNNPELQPISIDNYL